MKDDGNSPKKKKKLKFKFKRKKKKKKKQSTLTQCPCMVQVAIPKIAKGWQLRTCFPKCTGELSLERVNN